jgi:asparagine synthase (glutamine-hydrolysing)
VLTRGKQGFSIPMKNWLRHELKPLMEDVLSPARLRDAGLFNPAHVEALKAQHLAGVANHAHRLWSLMILEIWRSLYLR